MNPSANAQEKAENLFKTARKTVSVDQKIELLTRAIEQDPGYIQAYLELGLAYRQKGNLEQALIHLRRTLVANPGKVTRQFRFQVVYEIGTIQMAQRQFPQAKESLLAATQLSDDNLRLADIYYLLGEINTVLNKIDEAMENYSTGRILNQQDPRFDSKINLLRQQKRLYDLYLEAGKKLALARYAEAVADFEKVVAIDANFKDASQKLAEARSQLKVETDSATRQQLEQIYTSNTNFAARDQNAPSNRDLAVILKENEALSPKNAITAETQTPEPAQSPQPLEKETQIENLYQTALRNFDQRNWRAAIQNFEAIQKLSSDYRDVPKKLAVAKENYNTQIEDQQLENVEDKLYQTAAGAIERMDFPEAEAQLQRLLTINPQYRDAPHLLARIKEALADTSSLGWKRAIYQQGLDLMNQKNWLEARIAFEKIAVVDSNYENVQALLNESKSLLAHQTDSAANARGHHFGGEKMSFFILLALLVLLSGGLVFLVLKPELLANFYFRRGNFNRAAAVYEKILQKNKSDLNAIRFLAQIYFQQKREDQPAIRVYENVIQMDLDLPFKSDISTILAYYYLSNGDTDSQKVARIEKVLHKEINKIKSTKG